MFSKEDKWEPEELQWSEGMEAAFILSANFSERRAVMNSVLLM